MKVSEMEARGTKTLVAGEPRKEPSWLVWTRDERLPHRTADGALGRAWHGRGIVLRNYRRGGLERDPAPDAGDGFGVPEHLDSGCDLPAGAARSCGT